MAKIKVLVVDDNAFDRDIIAKILSNDRDIHVIGTAQNGRQALEKVLALKPDLVTMDICMPEMGGLEAIERIMAQTPVPILVISSIQKSVIGYNAIAKGAMEVIPKTALTSKNAERVIQQIKMLAKVKTISHIRANRSKPSIPLPPFPGKERKVIAIAASTGGPRALYNILSTLPKNYPFPIMVAQHIDPDFISKMINWLDTVVKIKIKTAEQNEQIQGGTAYFASPGKHLTLADYNSIRLVDKDSKQIYIPSCNMLMESVGDHIGINSVGIILTGMSDDGVTGMEKLKQCGGITIAQDESSALIFGMPKLAIESGCIDRVLPLDQISRWLVNFAKNGVVQ
ncbi:MAG: chemotaxis-specific protein-glutamate methyltransferase CheB [Desulfobacteraceae bacterium]|nr:chemotaxis-specific protein-glutamate methyltransferase CheB [Desulfobacteraceae bacterium]